MTRTKLFLLIAASISFSSVLAQSLTLGGQFKDRILPMEGKRTKTATETVWGDSKVAGRYLDNGIEPVTSPDGIPDFSYWGGNVLRDEAGTYHLYVAAWDATSRAHSYWPNSDIYHATATSLSGPYTLTAHHNIGSGHNPTVFKAKDGTYVLYALISNSAAYRYVSSALGDDWGEKELMPTDLRGRALSTGSTTAYSNWTFTQRADGSVYCMDRGGAMWISEDGLKAFEEVYDVSAYPGGYQRYFEDPVVWRDEFQYHMIVNHWNDKKAYYSRSRDGIHWISEEGTAYDPTVAVHADGTREAWTKFERPRIYQDKYGRAVALNMAVIDVEKGQDAGGDTHSSKNIFMPLNPGLRMAVLNDEVISTATAVIKVIVYKEDGFHPATDLDVESLRFGNYSVVNQGGGSRCVASENDEEGNLILTFNGKESGITTDEFAPKLIGRYAADYTPAFPNSEKGGLCYGYARLGYIDYEPAILSPALPVINAESRISCVEIKNYGLKASEKGATVRVLTADGKLLASGEVPVIAPYATAMVNLKSTMEVPSGTKVLKVTVHNGENETDTHTLQLTDIIALKERLLAAIAEAGELLKSNNYKDGKEKLQQAVDNARQEADGYYATAITDAMETLSEAVNAFKFANASIHHPVSITLENASMQTLDGWTLVPQETGSDPFFKINNVKNYGNITAPFVEAWSSTGLADFHSMSQTVKNLPQGRYTLVADVIARYRSGNTGCRMYAGDSELDCNTGSAQESTKYELDFSLDSPQDVTIGLKGNGGNVIQWMAWDNVQLLYYGDGRHDDELFYKASVKNVYLKASGQKANHIITVEPDHDNYLNRRSTPDENSVWAVIKNEDNGNTWLYNVSTQSFIIPEGKFWKTSASVAQRVASVQQSGEGFLLRYGDGSNSFLNAYGGFVVSRDITDGLKGYPVSGYSSGVWEMPLCDGQQMPDFSLGNITTGREELATTLASLPRAAVIETELNGYTTFCTPFDVNIPVELKAYTASIDSDGSSVILSSLEGCIPANTPVILYSDKPFGPYYVCGDTEAESATCAAGMMTGVLSAEMKVTDGCYLLQVDDLGEVSFVKTTEDNVISKNHCYIPFLAGSMISADRLPLRVSGASTAVGAVRGDDSRPASCYDLQGRIIPSEFSLHNNHIYIRNAKKFIAAEK